MLFPKTKRVKLSRAKYSLLCQYIAERDYVCRGCYKNLSVDVHHLVYRSQGGDDSPRNCVGLCRSCHDKAHRRELVLPDRTVRRLASEPDKI